MQFAFLIILFLKIAKTIHMKKIFRSIIYIFYSFCIIFLISCSKNENTVNKNVVVSENKNIFLTFDDGPTNPTTPKILKILNDEKVKATFFVVGRQIPTRKDVLEEIAKTNLIGIHTQTHIYSDIYRSPENLKRDILDCKREILKVLPNYNLKLYRFPGGSFNLSQSLKDVPKSLGLSYFDWNSETGDAINRRASPEELFANAVKSGQDRNQIILLLHDGVNFDSTVQALPRIIQYYKNKNYQFKTLNEIA